MVERKSVRYWLFALALLLTVFYLFPLVLVGMNSLKTTGEFTTNPFSLPTRLVTENYPQAFNQMHFLTSLCNTLILTVTICFLVAILGSMAAYVVSRVKSRFVSFFYYLMIASMCAPFQAFMIPLVKLYAAKLGFTNSLLPVIYIATGLNMAFATFLVRGFLNSIPLEIDQAAMIDGCNKYTIFTRIILPLLGPSIITTIVISFYWIWDDYMGPLLYLSKPALKTVSLAIKGFADSQGTNFGPMFAMSTLSLIPVFALFLFFNRYLMDGVTAGSIKG